MLTAALLHTSWHLMVKSNDDRLTVLVGMNLVASIIALCALPFAAVPFPAPEVWPVLALSVAPHAGNNLALPLLYRDADIGQAFPIARGLTPVFATLLAYLALGIAAGSGYRSASCASRSPSGCWSRATRWSTPTAQGSTATGSALRCGWCC